MKKYYLLFSLLLTGIAPAHAAGTLNFYNVNEPEFIDPARAKGVYENHPVMALFEGLVEYDPKTLDARPAVAERWTISPDGKTYTFFLRKDAKWSDGTPVTAQDFVYSWERVLNPQTGAEYAFQLFAIQNAESYNAGKLKDPSQLGFRAKDATTLVVTLAQPTPYFLFQMAFMTARPVPKWAIEKHGSHWTLPENIVGNGAFVLKKWSPQNEMRVEKNPTYWDAKNVQLDAIRFIPTEDKATALKQYLTGEIDVLFEVPFIQQKELMSRPDSIKAPYMATLFLRINVNRPPFEKLAVRQAISKAIDRKTLATEFLNGAGAPATTMVPNMITGYPKVAAMDFNPEEARALLKSATIDPAVFSKMSLHYNTDDMNKVVMQVIQQMLAKNLGVQIPLYNEEWKTFLKTQQAQNYDISRSRWVGDFPDPMTFLELWIGSSSMNKTGWKNARFDQLIEAARKEPNTPRRMKLLHDAEAILLQEAPVIPVYTLQKIMLMKPTVLGFYPNSMDIHPPKYWALKASSEPSFWQQMQTPFKRTAS